MTQDKLIITVAPTGSFPTKEQTPYLPVTPDEIVDETYKAYQAGASVVHLHARDPRTGDPSSDPTLFREYITRIRDRCDIIVNFTTGGGRSVISSSTQENVEIVRQRLQYKPELASLNMGSINFWGARGRDPTSAVFMNPILMIESFAKLMRSLRIKPELEIYDTGMICTANSLLEKGVLKAPLHFQFVMGGWPTCIEANPRNLIFLKEQIPANSTWSVCAVGRHEFPIVTMAMILGGHVRVGMEDNIRMSRTALAKSNAELVSRVVRIAKELDREIATPEDASQILGLRQ